MLLLDITYNTFYKGSYLKIKWLLIYFSTYIFNFAYNFVFYKFKLWYSLLPRGWLSSF